MKTNPWVSMLREASRTTLACRMLLVRAVAVAVESEMAPVLQQQQQHVAAVRGDRQLPDACG
jgi:hypothetical protein